MSELFGSELTGSVVFSPLLIFDTPKSGAENMAVDESLLDLATERNMPVLRFYYWNEPTLSLGYFQKDKDVVINAIPIVRRKSGGGAILHEKELTYCLAVPPGHPFAKNHRLVLYEKFHRCIISVLAGFGIECFLFSDWKKTSLKDDIEFVSAGNEEFFCFKRFADGDVVSVYDGKLVKLIGSAQYRSKNGARLQHGSILWDRSEFAPELPGILQLLENKIENRLENSGDVEVLRGRIVDEILHQLSISE